MQTVTREEFLQWKQSPVTEEIFETIRNRVEDAKEMLASTAGQEPDTDRLLVGMIKAFRELLDITFE